MRVLVYQRVKHFNIAMPQTWCEGRAGADWITGSVKGYQCLSIRTPEASSIGRATTFNKAKQRDLKKRKTCHTKSTSSGQFGKEKRAKYGKKTKTKAKSSLTYESPEDNGDADVCIVCLSPWSASNRREEWFVCIKPHRFDFTVF